MSFWQHRKPERAQPLGTIDAAPASADDGRSHLVSFHIALVKQRDPDGMRLIYERYLAQLLRYVAAQCTARPRLGASVDDLAAETLESFWRRAEAGKFPDLVDREGLWRVLCTIAQRKVAHRARDEHRLKRGGGLVILASDIGDLGDESVADVLDRIEGREPPPEDVAIAADILATARAALPDASLLDVLNLWLEQGCTQPEIARALGCSLTTVSRRMAEIRARLRAVCGKLEPAET